MGYTLAAALRYGVALGCSPTRRGWGTSAMAHAAAEVDCPARQGCGGSWRCASPPCWVCTATALVILVSGGTAWRTPLSGGRGGSASPTGWGRRGGLLLRAGGPGVGRWSPEPAPLASPPSILGWSWYGSRASPYLTGPGGWSLHTGWCSCPVWCWGACGRGRQCGSWWTCATR